jgi:hypothetical protein
MLVITMAGCKKNVTSPECYDCEEYTTDGCLEFSYKKPQGENKVHDIDIYCVNSNPSIIIRVKHDFMPTGGSKREFTVYTHTGLHAGWNIIGRNVALGTNIKATFGYRKEGGDEKTLCTEFY